jgi:hypothetical protein
MTLAEIITTTRGLCNEVSTDSGALLSDSANLKEFINDAAEMVCLDLLKIMPEQFLTTETISLVANTQAYTFTAKFWQVYKITRNITSESPREINIIDPLDEPYYMETAETDTEPTACYFMGDTLYWVPIPSTAYTSYAKAWLVRPEAVTVDTAGPAYIPAVAHRLIAYQAAALVAIMLEKDPSPFTQLYARRFGKVAEVWAARHPSKPRFVRESVLERSVINSGLSTERDLDW